MGRGECVCECENHAVRVPVDVLDTLDERVTVCDCEGALDGEGEAEGGGAAWMRASAQSAM